MTTPPTRAALRRFGYVMAGPFALFAGLAFWKHHPAAPYLAGVVAFFVLTATLSPGLLRPVERYWMKFAHYMSIVSTFVILTSLFYLVLTPMHGLLRLMGKDLLRLRRPTGETYWQPTEPDGPATRPDRPY